MLLDMKNTFDSVILDGNRGVPVALLHLPMILVGVNKSDR